MKFLILKKRHLTLLGAVLASAAIFAAVQTPAAVTASATQRQLPIYCVDRDQKVCAISFDAAWGADNTQKILDVLDEYNIKATFFVVSAWAEQYPDTAKAIVEHGHELMNHSTKHDHYNSLTADQIVADVNKCNDVIEGLTGIRPTLIRCPFGEYDDHVISAIRSTGMEPIQWDVEQSQTTESPLAIRLCGLLEGYYGRSENGLPDRPLMGGQAPVHAPPPRSQGPRNTALGARPRRGPARRRILIW